MKKSIFIFLTATVLSIGMIVFGWTTASDQIGKARLTEETITGDRAAADGRIVAFRADSADDLHWINGFDYSTNKTVSSFMRGEMETTAVTSVYDDMRFTGWSAVPYYTQLKYDALDGLQDKKIQNYYDKLQKQALADGKEKKGTIRTGDYLDYYPISFRFQFGEKVYNSSSALTGLKILADKKSLNEEKTAPYAGDIELYTVLNDWFRIPVIDNEYQDYSVSSEQDSSNKRFSVSKTTIKKPLGAGKDYYEFDPVIFLQQENIRDGKEWEHPDTKESLESQDDNNYHKASEYGLKNRLLFVVNNRTVKGKPVDVSQIKGGYGVYELPIDTDATISIGKGRKNLFIPDPTPLSDQLKMTYPLDETAEYVDISLSGDHRNLAIFSIKEGDYFVEIVDADTWQSKCKEKMFPASEKISYAWGEDGTLAATDHNDHIAILTENDNSGYRLLYAGGVAEGLDDELFTTEMVARKNSHDRYEHGNAVGLAVTAQDGKVALVQNSPAGNPKLGLRNADLECAVIDKTGVVYNGLLKSSLVDIDYGSTEEDINAIEDLAGGSMVKNVIKPVSNKNRAEWKAEE